MKIHFADSEYWNDLSIDFQVQYENSLRTVYAEVHQLLPFGSGHLNFFVQPREYDLIPETHDSGTTFNSEFIAIAFDPKFYVQHPKMLEEHIKSTIYHEMNHAARFNLGIRHVDFLDMCILEGLATVFEREYAHTKPLWGQYPPDAVDWLSEIRNNTDTLAHNDYMFTHPDGRKWIGYKTGTYIIDQALVHSNKTVIDLTKLECKKILDLARVQ